MVLEKMVECDKKKKTLQVSAFIGLCLFVLWLRLVFTEMHYAVSYRQ